MDSIVYLIQPFSRDDDGRLVFDAPAWSRDRVFAASLTQSLARRKAGVMTFGTVCDFKGELSPEAEIVDGRGFVPTSLVLPVRTARGEPVIIPRIRTLS
jgi:hypothetical protein